MTAIFADSYFYVALLSRRDKRHSIARDWATRRRTRILTTEFILLEVANFCRSPRDRQRFTAFATSLRTNRLTTIVPCDSNWFLRGLDRYALRTDKEWSLTDCISFLVMEDYGVTEALTRDHHFEQAGFRIVL